MTTELCRSALVSAGLQGVQHPLFLTVLHVWKTPSPWHRQSSLISSLSKIKCSEQRQEDRVTSELPSLQTCWGSKGGRGSAMPEWMEGFVHLNAGLEHGNAILRGTLRTCLLWPKLELALPALCALPGALPLQASLTHQQNFSCQGSLCLSHCKVPFVSFFRVLIF